eukprot:CAMPEP_0115029608 /NCGR_PEP_ID=MMETSP0216-20121206/37127_1 /TAXON_ID=223996 /ORGANISM="Protocruzia adherens, Strain Boccale" /LENGTH=298 /DNA_ID=CAMNT_0002406275 /DNA_START=366 /DNA_END=1262 /DNA_ORIENTATION=+
MASQATNETPIKENSPQDQKIISENKAPENEEKKKLVCDYEGCGKQFISNYTLKRHMLIHLDIKKYVCEFCGKRFTLKQYLKDHVNIHTGETPYSCDYPGCNKTFKQAGRRSRHRQLHRLEDEISKYKKNLAVIQSQIETNGGQTPTKVPATTTTTSANATNVALTAMAPQGVVSANPLAYQQALLAQNKLVAGMRASHAGVVATGTGEGDFPRVLKLPTEMVRQMYFQPINHENQALFMWLQPNFVQTLTLGQQPAAVYQTAPAGLYNFQPVVASNVNPVAALNAQFVANNPLPERK